MRQFLTETQLEALLSLYSNFASNTVTPMSWHRLSPASPGAISTTA
ncbi:hypothetical protein [Vibrio jasicida]|nr:hypothetical protein [Vibrio jasicida]